MCRRVGRQTLHQLGNLDLNKAENRLPKVLNKLREVFGTDGVFDIESCLEFILAVHIAMTRLICEVLHAVL